MPTVLWIADTLPGLTARVNVSIAWMSSVGGSFSAGHRLEIRFPRAILPSRQGSALHGRSSADYDTCTGLKSLLPSAEGDMSVITLP